MTNWQDYYRIGQGPARGRGSGMMAGAEGLGSLGGMLLGKLLFPETGPDYAKDPENTLERLGVDDPEARSRILSWYEVTGDPEVLLSLAQQYGEESGLFGVARGRGRGEEGPSPEEIEQTVPEDVMSSVNPDYRSVFLREWSRPSGPKHLMELYASQDDEKRGAYFLDPEEVASGKEATLRGIQSQQLAQRFGDLMEGNPDREKEFEKFLAMSPEEREAYLGVLEDRQREAAGAGAGAGAGAEAALPEDPAERLRALRGSAGGRLAQAGEDVLGKIGSFGERVGSTLAEAGRKGLETMGHVGSEIGNEFASRALQLVDPDYRDELAQARLMARKYDPRVSFFNENPWGGDANGPQMPEPPMPEPMGPPLPPTPYDIPPELPADTFDPRMPPGPGLPFPPTGLGGSIDPRLFYDMRRRGF